MVGSLLLLAAPIFQQLCDDLFHLKGRIGGREEFLQFVPTECDIALQRLFLGLDGVQNVSIQLSRVGKSPDSPGLGKGW